MADLLTPETPLQDLSCPDWFEKLKAGKPPLPDTLRLDETEAAAAVATYNKLRLPDVPGKPLIGDVGGSWAADFVAAIFGSVDLDAERKLIVRRHIRKFFQLVPKKNSKTTNGAAIMITALIRNRRPNAEFLLVGPTQATAERAFEQGAGMVLADPWLKKRFHPREHIKTIEDTVNGAKLRIRSFDNRVMTGAKPVGVLVDELHELGKMASAHKVMAQIEGGIIANEEGFVVIITTQSDAPPTGVFKQELEHARAVRDGAYPGGEMLPMMYEFPVDVQEDEAKPWENPEMWPLVMPNVGRSITIDRLLPKFHEAKAKGDDSYSVWASQHLNVQIGMAIGTWRGSEHWAAAAIPLTLDELLARSEVVTVGCDGGGLDDLFGLTVTGREKGTGQWLAWSHGWADRDVLTRRPVIASVLQDFVEAGELTLHDEPGEDILDICDVIEKVHMTGLLPEHHGVGLDPMGVSDIVDELANRGIKKTENGGSVTGVAQGYRLSGSVWGMERRLKARTYRPANQAITRWCASNARPEQRGNAVLITKETAGKAKIDLLVSALNAYALMARNPVAHQASITVPEDYQLCAA